MRRHQKNINNNEIKKNNNEIIKNTYLLLIPNFSNHIDYGRYDILFANQISIENIIKERKNKSPHRISLIVKFEFYQDATIIWKKIKKN